MKRSWSPFRVGTGLLMGTWALLFWFLLVTGRWSLYVSTRTFWVVPTGAILLTAATLGRLRSARVDHAEPLSPRVSWTLGAIALPVVLILTLPPATLSGYALGRRSSFVGSGVSVSADDIKTGEISFIDIAAAQSSKEGMVALRARAGEEVTLQGFVWREPGLAADEILLTRYVVTCCVADATSAQVRVVNIPPGRFEPDDWVEVTGRIYPLGSEILVDASGARRIPQPARPYLTP